MEATFSRCTELLKTLKLGERIFWGMLFYVETCMNCQGYVKVICIMFGYAVVFWACIVWVGVNIWGMVGYA